VRWPVSVLGFGEPSATFVLNSDPKAIAPDALRTALVEGRPQYLVSEAHDTRLTILGRFQMRRPRMLACVSAMNVMRGCHVHFRILSTGEISACDHAPEFDCTPEFAAATEKARENKACD
jgi:hypothetical protein